MTSVEIPYSIACALPSLTVIDITNDVSHELARDGHKDGIAYISPADETGIVRVNEREQPEGKPGQKALVAARPIHAIDGTQGD